MADSALLVSALSIASCLYLMLPASVCTEAITYITATAAQRLWGRMIYADTVCTIMSKTNAAIYLQTHIHSVIYSHWSVFDVILPVSHTATNDFLLFYTFTLTHTHAQTQTDWLTQPAAAGRSHWYWLQNNRKPVPSPSSVSHLSRE